MLLNNCPVFHKGGATGTDVTAVAVAFIKVSHSFIRSFCFIRGMTERSVARYHGTTAAPRYHFSTVPVPSPLRYFSVPQYHKYRGSSAQYLSVVDTQ